MKTKIMLMALMIFASFVVVTVNPVTADLEAEDYDITKYDPMDDVMRVRSGGDFKFSPHDNVEIKWISSSYDSSLIPKIELKMTVKGQIKNHEDYKYAFTVIADGDEYIFAAYQNGIGVGFEMGSSQLIIGVSASGENTNTLTITFPVSEIGPPDSEFDIFGAAVYSVEDSERFIDMAPDKLLLITEPSDGSTVSGDDLTVTGEIRQYHSGVPTGTIKLKIDNGPLEDVIGSDPWSYKLDTTSLTDDEHTIYVEIEGTEFNDEITIYVDQDTGNYKSFSKSDNRFPNVGDWYKYTNVGNPKISGINLPFTSEMTTQVTDLTSVDGTEVYQVESHSEGEQDLGYIRYNNTVDRTSWKETDELGTVKENTISTVEVTFRPDTEVNTTTEYTPPLDIHNGFEVEVGFDNLWKFHTTAKAESETTVAGGGTTQDSYNEPLDVTSECLYYLSSHPVPGGNFQDIYVIRSYYENPGVSIVEFYSPEMGVPVQIDTYDASRNLLFSLGISDHFQVPFSVVIDAVSFDPSKPKADSENNIIVTVNNIGTETASNVEVTAYDGDSQIGQGTISSIAAGENVDETIKWTPKSEGSHTIRITLSYDDTVLAETTTTVTVEEAPPDDGVDMFFILLLLFVCIVVAVIVVVVMKTRGKKSEEAPPVEAVEAVEAQEVEAAPVEAAPAGGVVVASQEAAVTPEAAAPTQAAATPAQPQMQEETIQCPSCKNGFTIKYESKPVKVKCPNCGIEGVLN